ncbi:MAG: Na/Pi symporter [Bacteroidetes bacterium]|nr:Na/Pi symporter [Bacteroidota bacterium]
MMVEIIGTILLGLGLMFTGVQSLSSGLKQLSSRKFRKVATQVVSSRPRALLFGVGSGMIMQSTSAALMILASLITAGLLNVSQAIAILTGFSVGNTVLLFFVTLHIESAVAFIVGACGIALYFSKSDKYRNAFLIGMGLGLIFFGIEIMTAGVKPLRQETWFTGAMTFSINYPFLSIFAGVLLGFIAQSSTAVALVAIGLAKANILTGPQTFLFMYGAAIGSTLFKAMLGQGFRGTSQQLVRFVNMFNIFGATVFILLYYIEVYFHVPLVMALVNYITPGLEHQASIVFLLFNLTSAIFFTVINKPLTGWLSRKSPPSEAESLAQPKYLLDFKPEDPESGLELINMEQTREFEQIAAMFSTARENFEGADLVSRYEAFNTLSREVTDACGMVASMPMHQLTAKDHAYYQTRQAILGQIAESVTSGVTIIKNARDNVVLERLSNSCMESLDFFINLALETQKSNTIGDITMFKNLSSGNSPSMERVRKDYINSDVLISARDKGSMLDLTIITEKIIWLLNRLISLVPPELEQ